MKDIWMNNRVSIFTTMFLATLSSVFFLVETFITRFIIQTANSAIEMEMLTIILLFVLMFLSYLVYFFRLRSANFTDYLIKKDLNQKYWNQIYCEKVKGFNFKKRMGDSTTFFSQKVSYIIYEYFGEIYELLYNSTFVLLGTLYIMCINFQSALVSIGFYIASILLSKFFSEKSQIYMEKINNSFSAFIINVDELFKNRNQIYCYDVFEKARGFYADEQEKYIIAIKKYEYIKQIFNTLNDILTRCREFVVLLIVVFMSQELVIANLFVILYLSNALSYPFLNFSEHINNILSTKKIRKEINSFSNPNTSIIKSISFDSIKEINMNNISVQKENTFLIRNFSMCLEKGKKYLLSGKSGSGKTTIIKTLLGFEEYDGEIKINNNLLKDEEQLYGNYFFITSDEVVFNDTVMNNITLFDEYVDEKKYNQITKKINLNLSPGLILNWEEMNVSGGEKQKILIARSLYNNHEILLIDEALAAIDQKSVKDIIDCIMNTDKMVILIDHNVDSSIIGEFDEIIHI